MSHFENASVWVVVVVVVSITIVVVAVVVAVVVLDDVGSTVPWLSLALMR